MILWTIQHRNAYEKMIKTGSLVADENYAMFPSDENEAYCWLSERMKERIGNPPKGVEFPVWAWYQWEGKRKRPDMRTHHRIYGKKGTPIVLLTFDIPKEKVVLTDFDMWHCILNNSYLPLTQKEDKDVFTDKEKIKSWDNVFKYDIETDYWDVPKTIQATMWGIRKEWILKVEHFLSR